MRKAKNSHGHFSKRQQTKAHPGNLLIYLLQRKPSSLMTCLIINSVYWTQKTTNKPTAQTKSNPLKYTITSIVQLSHTDLHGNFFIYVTIFATQLLATMVLLSKATVTVASTSRVKTSIPSESTTWLAPLSALNFHKRGYIACKSRFERSQDHQKLHHCYAGNCLSNWQ